MSGRHVESQPAYVLHSRPFRDSSLIVDFLTADFGRVSALVKGVRATSKSARQRRGLLQPFVPLLATWLGRSDLKTLTTLEAFGSPTSLTGNRLFSGLYANELLTRLLPQLELKTGIYTLYQWLLKQLEGEAALDIALRRFELSLLDELGYGLDFSQTADSEQAIDNQRFYQFDPRRGFLCVPEHFVNPEAADQFRGDDINAFAAGQFSDANRTAAKRLCRQALAVHLGDKPLKSRELFASKPKGASG